MRTALAAPCAAALGAFALTAPSLADEINPGAHLYDLKMKANAACRQAREYRSQMEDAWRRIQDDPSARDDYDLAYSMHQSQRELCLTAKLAYTLASNAERPEASTSMAEAADNAVPEGPPGEDVLSRADSQAPEGPPDVDAMPGADSEVPEGPPGVDAMPEANPPSVATSEVTSGACMVICDDVGFCQRQDYNRDTGVCTIVMNPSDPGFARLRQACPRVPPENWVIAYVGERWEIGCPPGSTGPIPHAPPPSQQPGDDLQDVQ